MSDREYFDAFYDKLKDDFLLSKSSVFESNNFTFKNTLSLTAIVLGLLLIVLSAVYIKSKEYHSIDKFDRLVATADSLILGEQARLDSGVHVDDVNTNELSRACALYDNALDIKIKDQEKFLRTKQKYDALSRVLDSCHVYNSHTQLIQQYILEQRIATAESLKARQTELKISINTIIRNL